MDANGVRRYRAYLVHGDGLRASRIIDANTVSICLQLNPSRRSEKDIANG